MDVRVIMNGKSQNVGRNQWWGAENPRGEFQHCYFGTQAGDLDIKLSTLARSQVAQ
jgi:hypothetical protein